MWGWEAEWDDWRHSGPLMIATDVNGGGVLNRQASTPSISMMLRFGDLVSDSDVNRYYHP